MDLKQTIKRLKNNDDFKNWHEKNKDNYLSYAMKIIDGKIEQPWQLGFYNKSTDRIVTFVVNSKIEMQKEEEIFKEPGMEVKKIDLENVKIPFQKIMKKAENFQKEKYPKEMVNKKITILQNLEKYGLVWNITLVTQSFSTLNIKINAEKGEVVYHHLESLMSMMKK